MTLLLGTVCTFIKEHLKNSTATTTLNCSGQIFPVVGKVFLNVLTLLVKIFHVSLKIYDLPCQDYMFVSFFFCFVLKSSLIQGLDLIFPLVLLLVLSSFRAVLGSCVLKF